MLVQLTNTVTGISNRESEKMLAGVGDDAANRQAASDPVQETSPLTRFRSTEPDQRYTH